MKSETKYEVLTFENLKKYRSFENISDMDEAIYAYIERLRADEVPESAIEVLRFLGRSSLRITGVSFAKYETIGKAIGKSRSTVIRAINTLAEYGMIDRIATVKKWRGRSRKKSVNIIVINPTMQQVEPQNETAMEYEENRMDKPSYEENAVEPVFSNHNNTNTLKATADNKAEKEPGIENHPRSLRQAIPAVIYEAMAPYFDANGLYKAYGTLLRAKANIDRTIAVEEHGADYVDVFLNVIRKYKQGYVRNLDSYLYSAWNRLSAEISRRLKWTEDEGGGILAFNPY
ncbi:hypothetical protein GCM10010978_10010 [Compostibacillus humi]|uniref:Helix-turn-helix domain-containing protein n=1 Tax=Compostibacillus humi TaxID=1245525 RepID=A0A8J3EKE8_9BACI|nr:helix-turn-helix domain-containing protein [Compostibacillus humi]GGH72791.1 hypothetical protein GCM10010978_10010 [Compostibacillus humi]